MAQEIFIFNTKDYVLYPVIKNHFRLSDDEIYNTIQSEFNKMIQRLSKKNIDYQKLKGALLPNQDKDKFETCFIIDSTLVGSDMYRYAVFDKFISLLDKESTYSILCGDYINIFSDNDCPQVHLKSAIDEVLNRYNESRYQHCSQYYLIYVNRLTKSQRLRIVDGLKEYPWFTGFADVSHPSRFKSYLAYILVHAYIKCGKTVIAPHPEDYLDDENVNMLGYPFEDYGFEFKSINETSFSSFLSYKIESEVPDRDDISFSFNALFPKFDSIEKLRFVVKDEKWDKYLSNPEKKGGILDSIGYSPDDKDRFQSEMFKQICSTYIYALRKNDYGDLLFDVCLDLSTSKGNNRKTTVGLKYHPESGEMDIITVT